MTTNKVGAFWRRTKPLHIIGYLITFHLIFSFIAMFWLAREFNFGKRAVLLHVSVVAGLASLITLILGVSLLIRTVREKRFPKLLLSCLPALSFTALLLLYLANYVSNSKWGNNFNYQVLAQWQLSAEVANQSQRLLAPQIYISLLLGLLVICAVYLALAKRTFLALKELFLPGRPLSWFRDPKRTRKSLVLLGLVGLISSLYLYVLARSVKDVGHLADEPIIGFFRNDTESAEDLSRLSFLPAISEREKRHRQEYPHNQKFSRRNVIVIMVDSLRPDHMQVYGYQRSTTPFLSSLAASGQLRKVDFALATCPFTSCGVMSTMASRTFKSLVPESFKLHELLFDQGYQVNFVLSGNHDWYNLKDAYGKSISYFFDGNNSVRYTANDDRVILEGLEKVAAHSGTPAFFYFHLMSPHYVGLKQDRYRVYNPSAVEGTWKALVGGQYDVATKTNNYDNGVVQADATIEQIFQDLKQKGYLDNSLAVILSDHGEGLGERGPEYYSHTLTLYQEFIRIPLFIYDPLVQGQGDLKFGRQIDVAPTVLERLGLSIPPSWQGRSLLQPSITSYSFHETRRFKTPIYAVIEWSESTIFKYVHSGADEDELYELVSDPREQKNLIATASPDLIARMKAKLAEYRSQY